ncbi:MAG: DUF1080 domain-containing protein [Planctomycetota bacterium]
MNPPRTVCLVASLALACQVFVATIAQAKEKASDASSDLPAQIEPSQESWHARYKKQENAPNPAKQLLNTDQEPDLTAAGFESLISGDDLSAWTPRGGTCEFVLEGGEIVGTCVPGSESTYLSTNRSDYADFIFSGELYWEEDGNTGVMFRAAHRMEKDRSGKDRQVVFGPQAEMEGFSTGRGWSGGIYGQSCGGYFYPLWLKKHAQVREALKPDAWNRITIEAKGNTVKTWINGIPASHWIDDGTYAAGYFGLQIHKGKSGKVRFRNLLVKEL